MSDSPPNLSPCPLLPDVRKRYRAVTHACPEEPAAAYRHRLCYAQSRWLEAKPAQALLQLNHAFTVDLPDDSPAHAELSWPYAAKLWLAVHTPPEIFLGNPVRHYQHYATRLPGNAPRRELRAVRAWLCFHLMRDLLPAAEFPRDEKQIAEEGLAIPDWDGLLAELRTRGRDLECDHVVRLRENPAAAGAA